MLHDRQSFITLLSRFAVGFFALLPTRYNEDFFSPTCRRIVVNLMLTVMKWKKKQASDGRKQLSLKPFHLLSGLSDVRSLPGRTKQ